MATDRASVEALKNMIVELETLISTTTPLPENRTPRCVELLRAVRYLGVPKRLSTKPAEADINSGTVVAFPVPVKVKNPAAVALGKLGGSKGGTIRALNLSSERKKAIAQKAAQARWAKARLRESVEANASHREGSS